MLEIFRLHGIDSAFLIAVHFSVFPAVGLHAEIIFPLKCKQIPRAGILLLLCPLCQAHRLTPMYEIPAFTQSNGKILLRPLLLHHGEIQIAGALVIESGRVPVPSFFCLCQDHRSLYLRQIHLRLS